ncbi:hypothetical protein MA5S0422_0189 [Mycobacteroides abscessus 5S-0422]|uniref:Uncharacterized protein n=1 Tax=Mycobacteroides abscessus subsp. bolletii 1513 TaxID=1299321 RepID=X8DGI3_9MYCO|nr:hypothetical protein MYCMA_13790 [Mycobacteroides abscessus subsp. massiliense str. GO 06]AMU28538.1 hypothetical protein A3N96_00665 [Mycobacteroides abscessus]EHB98046.1 hypothetical protein MAB47J26_16690 [Mycobacteroides abscessus 47J26]EHM22690.1 hypothetical protein MMAS_00770 [Mycobacteroides abscessus subsp. massiliense CCUG 48898 = JCM 15300]EIU06040.1 hypothetical protein MA5S0421_4756 [Mycobacteroides abscessus 5S-0421]EIU19511.1 hypothetical protein MA5S0422_0189 [Mycobacteroide
MWAAVVAAPREAVENGYRVRMSVVVAARVVPVGRAVAAD